MRSKSRGNGQGTAYKRGNTWTAQVVIGFHPNSVPGRSPIPIKRTKGGFPTKKAALAYCPTLLNGGVEKTEKAPRLSAYWDTYKQGEYKRLSDSKQTAYKIAWDKLKTLHDVPIDLITVDLLRSTVSAACTTYYPARDCRSLLANLYKIAAAEGRANKDLPSFIVLPKLNETERDGPLDRLGARLRRRCYPAHHDLYRPHDRRNAAPAHRYDQLRDPRDPRRGP